ncbi:hypothetical protein CC1G_05983 [Coprinopsis cinerea okayama7|uniref:Uncharacterized protein n=1 Tax=Coprinopsis cinerea (strain Okayama-7 / 130 / ATCC MYA-4618 / FGSC 9003) TaxID=240176 RepID=A8N4K5_COPC7|nr:hypothetical protein CC1G_05983 [Coprinopsis cinerea okayama7\|eukprot:XP_001829774.2 hypothetical protein CC1G_05983 [Coprinopsis cinerea okayama7\
MAPSESAETPSPSVTAPSQPGVHGQTNTGAIVGGATAALLILVILLVLIVVPMQRRRKQKKDVAARQMANLDPPYHFSESKVILMAKQGYTKSHHPTDSDLVGMMPLLSATPFDTSRNDSQKTLHYLSAANYNGTISTSTLPIAHISKYSEESFNPYAEYQSDHQANRTPVSYPMPPRPPQDVHARPSWTEHTQQSPRPVRKLSRALPPEPLTPTKKVRSPGVRPLPLPCANNGQVKPSPVPAKVTNEVAPASSDPEQSRGPEELPASDSKSAIPPPPPSVSTFPVLLERFQSVSTISDDSLSIYSQMSMSRSNTIHRDGHLAVKDHVAPPIPSLSAIAERLAAESVEDQSSSSHSRYSKSVKGKEKARPEDEEDMPQDRPSLRKLPTPPPAITPRPLPPTREPSSSGASSADATNGSSFICDPSSSKGPTVKRMDTVVIGNILRARRHSDAPYVALHATSSDDGRTISSASSSRISAMAREGSVSNSGIADGERKVEEDKKQEGGKQDEGGYGNIVRSPIVGGPGVRKIVVPREAPRGGRQPLGPRVSLRPRAVSSSSIISSNGTSNIRIKTRVQTLDPHLKPLRFVRPASPPASKDEVKGEGDGLGARGGADGWNQGRASSGVSPMLPPIPTSHSLYPLTGAFGLSKSPPVRSPETPSSEYDLSRVKPYPPRTAPLKVGGPKQRTDGVQVALRG